jgi:hypothetical protein
LLQAGWKPAIDTRAGLAALGRWAAQRNSSNAEPATP